MTNEPVAYHTINKDGDSFLRWTKSPFTDENIPLYTKEQLQPKVKMTQKQYDRLMWDKENTDLFQCIEYFNEHDGNNKFGLQSENLMGELTQEDIAKVWLNPEETIEIVQTKKWLVRSKHKDGNERFSYIKNILSTQVVYGFSLSENLDLKEDEPYEFDTKDDAEMWTNPLTEAVLLPVEDE